MVGMTLPLLTSTLAQVLAQVLAQTHESFRCSAVPNGSREQLLALRVIILDLGSVEAMIAGSNSPAEETLSALDGLVASTNDPDIRKLLENARLAVHRRRARWSRQHGEFALAEIIFELQSAQVAVALLAARLF